MKLAILIRIFFSIFFIPLSLSIAQNCFYVSTEGSNSNPGTFESPWKTIQYAFTKLNTGDTLFIRGGTYTGQSTLNKSGTREKPIVIKNYANELVQIDAYKSYFGIILERCHHVKLEGLSVFGSMPRRHRDQSSIYLRNSPSHITISKCNIYDGAHGIYTNPYLRDPKPRYITIKDCQIHHNDFCGIYINGTHRGAHHHIVGNNVYSNGEDGVNINCDSSIIEQNTIYDNLREGIYMDEDWTNSNHPAHCYYNIVRNNQIYNNGKDGIMLCHQYSLIYNNEIHHNGWNFEASALHGIYMAQAGHCIVFNNQMHHNANGSAVRVEGCFSVIQDNDFYHNGVGMYGCDTYGPSYNNIIRRNRIYKNYASQGGGIPGSGLEISGPKALHLYQNVVIDNEGFGCAVVTGLKYTSTEVKIKNNIIVNSRWNHLWIRKGSHIGYLEMHNNIYPDNAEAVDYLGIIGYYADYQTNTSHGRNSFCRMPLFIDQANGNFHLFYNSPCIDAGGFLTFTTEAGQGTQIPVEDVKYFCDGYQIIEGDLIQLEGQADTVKIVKIDYHSNILNVDRSLSWSQGQGVSLPYNGAAPDMGVYEFKYEDSLVAILNLSDPSPTKSGKVTVDLTTSKAVIRVPTPLFFLESDSTLSTIELTGDTPGYEFRGIFLVDSTVANGIGHFYLTPDALVDEEGHVNNKIISDVYVKIDQIEPQKPQNLRGQFIW